MAKYLYSFLYIILFVTAYLFSLLELLTYSGFFSKRFIIDIVFVNHLFVTNVLILKFSQYTVNKKLRIIRYLNDLAINTSSYIFLISVIVSVAFYYLEETNFPNYVFSNFHINIDAFNIILMLFAELSIIKHLSSSKKIPTIKKSLLSSNSFQPLKIIGLVIITLFILSIPVVVNGTIEAARKMVSSYSLLSLSSQEKMNLYWGRTSIFANEINIQTNKNVSIAIPPQIYPWTEVGNGGVMQYLLYPRSISRNYLVNDIQILPDYYLIVYNSQYEQNVLIETVWPDFSINAEYVQFYDFEKKEWYKADTAYTPDLALEEKTWGLIKTLK